jgi:hypothetical protein
MTAPQQWETASAVPVALAFLTSCWAMQATCLPKRAKAVDGPVSQKRKAPRNGGAGVNWGRTNEKDGLA